MRFPSFDTQQKPMANLPSDIIADILSRLEVKQLLCFKCVSKPWRNLIDGPDFINLHLSNSIKSSTNQALILKHSQTLYWVSLGLLNFASVLDHPLMCYNQRVKILGSCNGLLCISNIVDDIAFWNPCTKKHRVLPLLSLERKRHSGGSVYSVYVYGFGFDFTNDDYKLVRITQYRGVEIDFLESDVKVYSLARNYWKSIGDMQYVLRYPETNGVYVSGALHWIMSRNINYGDDYNVVLALELAVEDFKEVPLPDFVDKDFNLDMGVLGGCLSVVANFSKVRCDVWLMKEYGVKDSWTKLFSIMQEQIVGSFRAISPLGYSKGGSEVLLMQDRSTLVRYDLRKKIVKDVRIHGAPYVYEVEICLQSLVSFTMNRRNHGMNWVAGDNKKNVKKRDDFLSVGFKLVL